MTANDARSTRQASISELLLSLARVTPAFLISDPWTRAEPAGSPLGTNTDDRETGGQPQAKFSAIGQNASEFLIGLFAPARARSVLRMSSAELLGQEVRRVDGAAAEVLKRLGPPPGWTSSDGE